MAKVVMIMWIVFALHLMKESKGDQMAPSGYHAALNFSIFPFVLNLLIGPPHPVLSFINMVLGLKPITESAPTQSIQTSPNVTYLFI